ncbi:6-phospho-3-hexuloisomerase [Arthrobacter sp. H14-L1]|uniref:6-phospho-3-hexuloisomerase n=1 Tax=Arthrobacter sp. H14-L1 TaxID=2996697 RepID=UPI0022702F36|nr:6-phospho-3-hexuloisomerase [Arthrobacter sp. H14-L1]MCY0905930.1 6-phospho-3-hexuloisomerase [Arthrobacter sp. H14-L1]
MTETNAAPEQPQSDLLDVVLSEITTVVQGVKREDIQRLADVLAGAPRIFAAGEGRSGLMAKAFAMRLMHLGLSVHVIGESTTPSVQRGDVLVAISGSGTTAGTVRVAQQAATVGAMVHAVTTDPDSPLAAQAATVLVLPAATKYRRPGEAMTVQPLSSLFDQATHVALDVVCLLLATRLQVDNAAAAAAHANTE